MCLVFLIISIAVQARSVGLLTLNMFDVGQGDGIMIQTPYDQQILVDAGPGRQMEGKVSSEMPLFDRTIETVIISHPHADHVNGLFDILKHFKVERVVWSGVAYNSKIYDTLRDEVKKRGIAIQIVRDGDTLEFGPDMRIEIIAPVGDVIGKEFKDVHEGTVVGRLVYKNTEVLLTGDVNEEIEEAILAKHRPIESDILKVSHHGSRYSTSEAFLDKVHPEYAIISVGKDNRYGHPHVELLDRLELRAIPTYRTDQQGDIRIITNGDNITITHK